MAWQSRKMMWEMRRMKTGSPKRKLQLLQLAVQVQRDLGLVQLVVMTTLHPVTLLPLQYILVLLASTLEPYALLL